MERDNNKIVIIFLIVLILGLCSYIVIDKINEKKAPQKVENVVEEKDNILEETDVDTTEEDIKEPDSDVDNNASTVTKVIDLGFATTKGLSKVAFNHSCYKITPGAAECPYQYEYELTTTDSELMVKIFETIKKDIDKKVAVPVGLGGIMENFFGKFYYDNNDTIELSYIMNGSIIIAYKNDSDKAFGAWKVSSKYMSDIEKVMSSATKTYKKGGSYENIKLVDLGFATTKGLAQITYKHECYLACPTEYEYDLVTTEPDMMVKIFETIKKDIVKKVSVPTGLGGPVESFTGSFYYTNNNLIELYYIKRDNIIIAYKNGSDKAVGAWKVSSNYISDIEKAMSTATKIEITEERPVGEEDDYEDEE